MILQSYLFPDMNLRSLLNFIGQVKNEEDEIRSVVLLNKYKDTIVNKR